MLLVEFALVLGTTLVFARPLLRPQGGEVRERTRLGWISGWALLSATFCWSVLAGGYWAVISRLLEFRR